MSIKPITDYQQAARTLRQNDLRQGLYDEGAVLMEGVLVNLHGEKHRARRGLENKVFRRGFLQHYEKEVFPDTLRATIDGFVADGGGDLVEFGFRSLMNLTCDFAGIDRPRGTREETDRLLLLMRTFALGTTLAHSKDDREKVRQQVRDALSAFDKEFLQPSMAHRLSLITRCEAGELEEDELPRDVLTVLLRNEDHIEIDDQELVREMAFFVVAGAQTSIHSLVHVMHEIFAWSADRPGEREKIVSDPMLLQRCVHESARLHPSSPVARRRAECPVTLATDETVETDELVTIDLLGANRDEKIFGPDAAEFNPYRKTDKSTSPYGLSFGLGMHACIGRTLAAGVTPKADSDPLDHQYGTITLIVRALLERGARPDPEKPPEMDKKTERPNWGYYPVILEAPVS
ncbi:MAG: cytochrome P450 [Proteobacteria bacterium]|nr:cytochrome P450 [Pseudomonadota bacterium]